MPPGVEGGQSESMNQEEDGSWVDAQLLKEVLPEGATILHIDVQRATAKGDNYLSVLYRTRVQYRVPGSDDVRVETLMVKALPPGEFIQKYIEESNIFRREAAIYSEVLPRLYAFAASSLGEGAFKTFSAGYRKCSRPDTLIFDDLKPHGFIMASRKERLDFAHSKLVVQNLARLHALSAAYVEEYPSALSQFEDHVFSEECRGRLDQFVVPMMRGIAEEVRKWEGFSEIANKLEKQQDTFVEKVINMCKSVGNVRRVLIHGDSWINNVLFKYFETGEPVDLMFVDFQLTRNGSPALDLNYFLFTSPRLHVRQRHYDDLLREYCNEFSCRIKELGYNGLAVTFEDIQLEMKRTAIYGFTAAMSTMAIILSDPDDIPSLDEIPEDKVEGGDIDVFGKSYQNPKFRESFEDLLPYFDKIGVFD